MKNKKVRIYIDIVLLLTTIFTLISLAFSNIIVHIVSGIILIPIVVAHFVVNFSWTKAITKNLFKGKLNKRTIRLYIVFILLKILFLGAQISGLIVTAEIVPPGAVETFHGIPSMLFYIVIIIHVLMHIEQIKAMIGKRKISKNKPEDKTTTE